MTATVPGGVTFFHRDHYNARKEPKRPLTLARAQEVCDTYNATQYGRNPRFMQPYRCSVCHQWHVGHVNGSG